MHRFLSATALVVGALLPQKTTQAQPMLAPSQALACMTPALDQRGLPEYDEDAIRGKDGGAIKVELVFVAPDRAPTLRVLTQGYTSEWMRRSVERYAQRLRIPCMPPVSEPVRITQEYVFVPNDGRKVVATAPSDLGALRKANMLACITRITGPASPSYPWMAQAEGLQENVLVSMRFLSPNSPPQVSYVNQLVSSSFKSELDAFSAGYRMPCHESEPVDVEYLYMFKIDGGARIAIKDIGLRDFLGAAKEVPRGVFFDLNTLQCPFDLRVTFMRPYRPNKVQELDRTVPERRAFMDWIGRISLRTDPQVAREIFGDQFTLHVPCGKVDL